MVDNVISQVKLEISLIDDLFQSYSNLLLRIQEEKPDLIETTALASILHSFYNGLENIFLCIAKGIDHNVPAGDRWHRDLLNQMGEIIPARNQVLTSETIDQLTDYMGFRHFFRHSYSFSLEWEELEKLVSPVEKVWKQTKDEFEIFMNSLIENEI